MAGMMYQWVSKWSVALLAGALVLAACGGAPTQQHGADGAAVGEQAEAGVPLTRSEPAPAEDVLMDADGEMATTDDTGEANNMAIDAAAEVDILFEQIGADEPGAAVIVVQNGEILHQQGYGQTELGGGNPITPATIFHIGSAGKQMTGVALMLLHQEGLIDYDAGVVTYLPELAGLADEVTIRQLLHHTGGMPDYYDELEEEYDTPTNADALAWLAAEGSLVFEPGTQFEYSNSGYELLGTVIERVSGQSFGDFMEQRVFRPLGMNNTFSVPNPERLNDPLRARGYTVEDGVFELYDSDPLDNLVGSGSVYSSVFDLNIYMAALLNGRIVPPEALRESLTPGEIADEGDGYGFGWSIIGDGEPVYIGHNGSWQGFTSNIGYFPQESILIVVLSSRDDLASDDITLGVAETYGVYVDY